MPLLHPPAQNRVYTKCRPGFWGLCLGRSVKPARTGVMKSLWATYSDFSYWLFFPPTRHLGREPGSTFPVTSMQVLQGRCQVPPRPSLLQAAQAQLSQPLLSGQVPQPPEHVGYLHWTHSSLSWSFSWWEYTRSCVKKHWVKENNPFPVWTAQDAVGCRWCQGSLLAQAQLTVHKLHEGLFCLLLLFTNKGIIQSTSQDSVLRCFRQSTLHWPLLHGLDNSASFSPSW